MKLSMRDIVRVIYETQRAIGNEAANALGDEGNTTAFDEATSDVYEAHVAEVQQYLEGGVEPASPVTKAVIDALR